MWTEDATSTKRGATEIRSAKVKDCNALGAEFEGPIATTNHCEPLLRPIKSKSGRTKWRSLVEMVKTEKELPLRPTVTGTAAFRMVHRWSPGRPRAAWKQTGRYLNLSRRVVTTCLVVVPP